MWNSHTNTAGDSRQYSESCKCVFQGVVKNAHRWKKLPRKDTFLLPAKLEDACRRLMREWLTDWRKLSARMGKSVLGVTRLPLPKKGGGTPLMFRKLFTVFSFAGLILVGISARGQPTRMQSDLGKQSAPATKSVAGKVTSIGNSGASFAVEVEGSSKDTMQFVVNKNTRLQGQVKIGTLVAVEYQPIESGENLAVSISVRG